MSCTESAFAKPLLNFRRELQKSEHIGNRDAVLADAPGYFLLSQAKLNDQALIGLGFLNGVQIFSLQVFDQCDFEGGVLAGFANDRRDARQARTLGSPPASFARNQLEKRIRKGTDDNRLDDAMGANGV